MFTGIIKETVSVKEIEEAGEGLRVSVTRPQSFEELSKGESISLSGVCLTVEAFDSGSISFFLAEETLEKSWFSKLEEGDEMNAERALRPQDRMGGHIVQGHVEAVSEVLDVEELEEGWNMTFSLPDDLQDLVVYKGFIAVEGISLTVTDVTEDSFSVTVIPETWRETNLSDRYEGDKINIETDMMGKYVKKMMEGRGGIDG
ncbi:riboflavin synthase [Candidatus Nanosalina sp. VS9-1]|uniref:riboflavin synthase n=1 Tax=Candidatus Nanosalina sp. VS9-1 TaxID=3388566 RepID=UPI0039E1485F